MQMVKYWWNLCLLFITFIVTSSALPTWYHHVTRRSAPDYELLSDTYSFSLIGECGTNELVSEMCYFCGKVVESEQMLLGCCETDGIIRDFCFDLLS